MITTVEPLKERYAFSNAYFTGWYFGFNRLRGGRYGSSNYTYVPWIQLFQKVDSTGQTNFRERKEALYSCGIDRSENLDDKHWSLNTLMPNETSDEQSERFDRVIACMKRKG